MKILLSLICCILAVFSLTFPFYYYNSPMNKKEVKLSHLVVDTKEEAEKIRQEIFNGKNFETAAKEYSKDTECNIGYNVRGVLIPSIEHEIFINLKKNGEISKPIHTEYGWHLLKITDVKHYSDKENYAVRYF